MNRIISSSCMKIIVCLLVVFLVYPVASKNVSPDKNLDVRVKKFLQENSHDWYDMNVPASDGKIMYDIIVKNNYKQALEIGTSTGHSGIWIAWALSKTGGKLITIEINERRYKTAVENFKKAGLLKYIDARLADAHKLVKELPGPFDFVFSDADKWWYKNYFLDVDPKLKVGGCFTAHNVSAGGRGWRRRGGSGEFYDHIKSLANYESRVDESGGGLSISYKKSEKK